MALSLLAHLYTHIRGSQEDIATLSLQYIISQNKELNQAFTKHILNSLHVRYDGDLNYVCQAVGDKKERPDIAGFDANGREQILCEAKFYAGLTENQPITYLDRLKKNNGLGLIFICPAVRRKILWARLLSLCHEKTVRELSEYCAEVDGIMMAIVAWPEIIDTLHRTASVSSVELLSDINQLNGFCKQMDQEAFLPYTEEELGPVYAKLENRPFQVIDALIDTMMADKSLSPSLKGLKATAYKNGYTRSIRIKSVYLTINYDRVAWANPGNVDTPFWFALRADDWKQTQEILNYLQRYPETEKSSFWNMVFLAIHPLTNATLDEVALDLKRQILGCIEGFEQDMNSF